MTMPSNERWSAVCWIELLSAYCTSFAGAVASSALPDTILLEMLRKGYQEHEGKAIVKQWGQA
jgi:hypothetical protein